MNNFTKVVHLGHGPSGHIFCKVGLTDGKLSISGVEGPRANGDAVSCGQIDVHLREAQDTIKPAPGWDVGTLARFFDVWDAWYLNDMKAGSPAQLAWLAANPIEPYSYAGACEALTAAGLNPDPNYLHEGKPYHYGHAWLREEVPEDVLAWLQALPDTDIQPAWV